MIVLKMFLKFSIVHIEDCSEIKETNKVIKKKLLIIKSITISINFSYIMHNMCIPDLDFKWFFQNLIFCMCYYLKIHNFYPVFLRLCQNVKTRVGHFDKVSKNWIKIMNFPIIAHFWARPKNLHAHPKMHSAILWKYKLFKDSF